MNSTVCVIAPNPDVTGVGIRASIYTLCLASTILTFLTKRLAGKDEHEDFARSIDQALNLQGLALLCTAVSQTFRKQLTLFHAICVLHLLALLGVGLYSKGKYGRMGPRRLITVAGLTVLAVGVFIAFNVYIWITAPTFGSQVACNASTVYVVFGVSINATNEVFRYIILATFALLPLSLIIFTLVVGMLLGCCWRFKRQHPERFPFDRRDFRVLRRPWIVQKKNRVTRGAFHVEFFQMLAKTGIYIYGIVSLEQTIGRNVLDREEGKWTFGQIIALFLLLGVANELFHIFLSHLDNKKPEPETVAQVEEGMAEDPVEAAEDGQGMELAPLHTYSAHSDIEEERIRPHGP